MLDFRETFERQKNVVASVLVTLTGLTGIAIALFQSGSFERRIPVVLFSLFCLSMLYPLIRYKRRVEVVVILCSIGSAMLMSLIHTYPYEGVSPTYYFSPFIVASSILLANARWGLVFLLLFMAYDLLSFFDIFYSKSHSTVNAGNTVMDRNTALVLIYSIFTYTNYSIQKALKTIGEQSDRINQQRKLEALATFSSGIAHEINNPLTIIRGYSEQIGSAKSPQGLKQDFIAHAQDRICQQVDRISHLTDIMVSLGRQRPLKEHSVETIDLESCINQLVLELQNQNNWPQQMKSRCTFHPDLQFLLNRQHLMVVLKVLMKNSCDATKHDANPWVDVWSGMQESLPSIRVTDSGPGVSAEDRDRLFEPFFTTKGVGEGSGMSLALALHICRELNWGIRFLPDSAHTTFELTFPQNAVVVADKRNTG